MSAAAGAGVARGPLAFLLQSQTGQWATISLGAIYAFPDQAKMVLGELGSLSGMKLPELGFGSDSGGKEIAATATTTTTPAAPIIIHQTVPATDGKNQYVTMLVKVAVGGTACWIGYIVFTNALPEYVQEFLPVTRKLFSKTSKFLASSVEKVRVALEEKIGIVSRKQDELGKKLDGTNDSVKGLRRELGGARGDLDKLKDSMARQESTLLSSHRTQSYTSKGVTLLVRCVATLFPSNDQTVHDLAEYIKDGEEIRKVEEEKERERRLSITARELKPVSMISPDPMKKIDYSKKNENGTVRNENNNNNKSNKNVLIRESRADSDLDSLEDVRSVLGLRSGSFLMA